MKKYRFPNVALDDFTTMPAEKIEREINRSTEALARITPKNHREELSLVSNYKRIEVLKVILNYRGREGFKAKFDEIAVLGD
ncbi:MAG: hypothetical protein JWP78_625 [Mucilaginibacter sp.]|nr:hypothetical protein [Mucilaginibacter sp.]